MSHVGQGLGIPPWLCLQDRLKQFPVLLQQYPVCIQKKDPQPVNIFSGLSLYECVNFFTLYASWILGTFLLV